MSKQAVLLMAYGTPRDLGDVEAYYTHIRRGHPPTPEALQELRDRYAAIGGRSPLLEITRAQAEGLEQRLGLPVVVGQKHAAPFIQDAFEELAKRDIDHVVGLVLAPHFSSMSIGAYEKKAREAAAAIGWEGQLEMVQSWHTEPGYIRFLADRLQDVLDDWPAEILPETRFLFTAHSLPARIVKAGDPYQEQLGETAACVAHEAGLKQWQVGWQSAGRTSDEWLGPDVLELVDEFANTGVIGMIVCPCGFVADHLEVLYDLDIEAKQLADQMGLRFARTASPNADPAFLDTLADVARAALSQPA